MLSSQTQVQPPLRIWLMAIRLRTLGAAIAPIIIATALAIEKELWDPWVVLAALLGSLLIQIGTNLANDYFDFIKGADTSERVGPTRITQAGLMQPQTVRLAFILTFALSVLPGAYLIWKGGWVILVVGLVSILSGILYTGGPFPLGYHGLGDLFVLIFFGFVATAGTYYLHTGTLEPVVFWAAAAPGLLSTAILVVNNLRDRKTDALTGKNTLAVRFGPQFARYEYLISLVLACLTPLFIYIFTPEKHLYSLIACGTMLLALPSIQQVFKLDADPRLNPLLGQTGKLLLVYSLLFSSGWLLG